MMEVKKKIFDTFRGETAHEFVLSSDDMKVGIITYGARIRQILYRGVNVLCGFDNAKDYLTAGNYHGALVGRYANRIAKGQFTLNGKKYVLAKNEKGITHLHGGAVGYSDRIWRIGSVFADEDKAGVTLSLFSPDGEEGYPGNLQITVTYTLTKNDELTISYNALTDADTIVNLTNHSYFNPASIGTPMADLKLTINADKYTPVDKQMIPTGLLENVENTPFDFRAGKKIGRDLYVKNEQLAIGSGYDHSFVLNHTPGTPDAILSSDKTGITMKMYTDAGGVQLYTGNFMDSKTPFYGTIVARAQEAVCLECGALPDTPNHPSFPTAVVSAGKTYTQNTTYAFSSEK